MFLSIPGRSPMFVVTHKDELKDIKLTKGMFTSLGIPPEYIFFFENYTSQSHTEDIEKDIKLLEFLKKALDMCDENIDTIESWKKENQENKPWLFKIFSKSWKHRNSFKMRACFGVVFEMGHSISRIVCCFTQARRKKMFKYIAVYFMREAEVKAGETLMQKWNSHTPGS